MWFCAAARKAHWVAVAMEWFSLQAPTNGAHDTAGA